MFAISKAKLIAGMYPLIQATIMVIIPHKRSVALSKFRDGYRNSIASQFGTRDAIIARFGR